MAKIAKTPNDMTTQVGYLKELQNYLAHLRLEWQDKMFEQGEKWGSGSEAEIVENYLTGVINDLQTDINENS